MTEFPKTRAAAALTALGVPVVLPAPAELDEILSRVLWARFAPRAVREEEGM